MFLLQIKVFTNEISIEQNIDKTIQSVVSTALIQPSSMPVTPTTTTAQQLNTNLQFQQVNNNTQLQSSSTATFSTSNQISFQYFYHFKELLKVKK